MEAVAQYLHKMTELATAEACKKSGCTELYVRDIARFVLAMDPVDRTLWIDSINKFERDALLEVEQRIESKRARLDLADGIASTMKTEDAELEG